MALEITVRDLEKPEEQEPDIAFAVKVARVPRKGGER